jgi:hypothetical protein
MVFLCLSVLFLSIGAQAAGPGPSPNGISGTVQSITTVSGALQSFVLRPFAPPNQPQPPDLTILVTAGTKYFNGPNAGSASDVKAGVNADVLLQAPLSNNQGTAQEVHILPAGPPPPKVAGTVKSISPATGALQSFVLRPFAPPNQPQPPDLTISVTANTKYFNGPQTATSDVVKVGVAVEALLKTPPQNNAGTAVEVHILPPPKVAGTVKSISPATGALQSFVLQPPTPPGKSQPPAVTISVTARTRYFTGKQPATAAAVKVGVQAEVMLQAPPSNNQGTAVEVHVRKTTNPTQAGSVRIVSACALPVASGTQVLFTLSAEARVTVQVCSLAGRPVRQLAADRPAAAGVNSLAWDATSDSGLKVPAGQYLVRITARAADGTSSSAVAPVTVNR